MITGLRYGGLLLLLSTATPTGAAPATVRTWERVSPGGASGCAWGTPFTFEVRHGDPSRVLIYLQGGGACWDLETCHPRRSPAFDPAVTPADTLHRVQGLFDDGAATPLRGSLTIFVPYCTGDMHLGARSITYPAPPGDTVGPVTVRHAGYHNVRAVLDWLRSRASSPARIVVAGGSAGAVAAPIVAAEAAVLFPHAQVTAIADGAGGLRVPATRAMLRSWGADSLLAARGLPLPDTGDGVTALAVAVARRHPGLQWVLLNSRDDEVVTPWLRRFGIRATHAELVDATVRDLRAAGACVASVLDDGAHHTVLWRPRFHDAPPAGVAPAAWLARALASPCPASPGRTFDRGDAAYLFRYRLSDAAGFATGYRQHLTWHAERRDSLAWLAWTILDGPDAGTFVDGSFGLPPGAFDARVDPLGDAADAARHVTPWAALTGRELWRLRRDLGTSTSLEAAEPAAYQRVVEVRPAPGGAPRFERMARRLRTIAGVRPWAVYERVSGGAPGYLVVVPLAGWRDLETPGRDPAARLLADAGAAGATATTAVWVARPDLTWVPPIGVR